MVTSPSTTPAWALRFLPDGERNAVEQAVADVERKTSAEIVVMVARGAAPRLTAAAVLLLALIWLTLLQVPGYLAWRGTDSPWIALDLALIALVYYGLFRSPIGRRLSHGRADEELLRARAVTEFYEAGLKKTAGRTGILIYLSLAERRAVVLADAGIATKVAPEAWSDVVERAVRGVKDGHAGAGLADAVVRCGDVVTPHFPPGGHNPDELDNAVRFRD